MPAACHPPLAGEDFASRGLALLDQRDLRDVDAAAAEAAFAIHQIIAPQVAEAGIEPFGQASRLVGIVEPFAPVAQRLRIIEAEGVVIGPDEAARFAQGAKAAVRQQHAAGEDVALYEIDAGGVAFEHVVGDADILDRGAAARLQDAGERVAIGGPIGLAHRLHHLDARDRVIGADDVAIVGERDGDAGKPAGIYLRFLFGREGEAMDAAARRRCRGGKGSPAAANFQHSAIFIAFELS